MRRMKCRAGLLLLLVVLAAVIGMPVQAKEQEDTDGGELTVLYRVSTRESDWRSWKTNGETSGTRGDTSPLDAIEIMLAGAEESGEDETPGPISVEGYSDTGNELSETSRNAASDIAQGFGETAMITAGRSTVLESAGVRLAPEPEQSWSGDIRYRICSADGDWTEWSNQGETCGSAEDGDPIEAIQICLSGEAAEIYEICYRVKVQEFGWLGWTKSGESAGTSGYGYPVEEVQLRLIRKEEQGPVSEIDSYWVNVEVPEPDDEEITVFGEAALSDDAAAGLEKVTERFTKRGNRIGLYMMDLKTGKGVYYNSNSSFYSASSIKGPYVVSLNEKVPGSVSRSGGVMNSTIKVSSNEGYASLRSTYGSAPFASWLSDAGVSGVSTTRNYVDITPRQLAQMWTKSYEFFYSGRTNSVFCRNLFTGTLNSPISNTMRSKYTVYSKAGWIGEGGYYHVQNDGGIVMRDGHPYVIVILSTAYGRLDYMNTLVSAIDAAHEELLK